MSDFGSMITVFNTGGSITDEQFTEIDEILDLFNSSNELSDAMGEPVDIHAIKGTESDGADSISIIVTEYWTDGFGDGYYHSGSIEEILDQDQVIVDEVMSFLELKLPEDFVFESYSGEW